MEEIFKNLKLVKKGWCLDSHSLDYESQWAYEYKGDYVQAETRNQAKSLLLNEIKYDNLVTKYGDELNYLNLPIKRHQIMDLYEFEGEELTRYKIEQILNKREGDLKLDNMLNDKSIKYCYIRKGSYYRPGSCGYTDMKHRAGVFTKEEAVDSAKSCRELTIIPINIEEHNKMITEEIESLKSRILN